MITADEVSVLILEPDRFRYHRTHGLTVAEKLAQALDFLSGWPNRNPDRAVRRVRR